MDKNPTNTQTCACPHRSYGGPDKNTHTGAHTHTHTQLKQLCDNKDTLSNPVNHSRPFSCESMTEHLVPINIPQSPVDLSHTQHMSLVEPVQKIRVSVEKNPNLESCFRIRF